MTTLEHKNVAKQCVVVALGTGLRWDKASGLNYVIFRLPSIIYCCHKLIFFQLEKSI